MFLLTHLLAVLLASSASLLSPATPAHHAKTLVLYAPA